MTPDTQTKGEASIPIETRFHRLLQKMPIPHACRPSLSASSTSARHTFCLISSSPLTFAFLLPGDLLTPFISFGCYFIRAGNPVYARLRAFRHRDHLTA